MTGTAVGAGVFLVPMSRRVYASRCECGWRVRGDRGEVKERARRHGELCVEPPPTSPRWVATVWREPDE